MLNPPHPSLMFLFNSFWLHTKVGRLETLFSFEIWGYNLFYYFLYPFSFWIFSETEVGTHGSVLLFLIHFFISLFSTPGILLNIWVDCSSLYSSLVMHSSIVCILFINPSTVGFFSFGKFINHRRLQRIT